MAVGSFFCGGGGLCPVWVGYGSRGSRKRRVVGLSGE